MSSTGPAPAGLEELVRDSVDRLTAGARLPAGFAPLVRRRARRARQVRYGAVAGVAALVTAATTLVATGASPGGPVLPANTALPASAVVISQVASALSAPVQVGDVIYTASSSTSGRPGGPVESQGWYTQGAARSLTSWGGKPRYELALRWSARSFTLWSVIYRSKIWFRQPWYTPHTLPVADVEMAFPLESTMAACRAARSVPDLKFTWQAYISAMLACHFFRVTGHGQAGGHHAIELTGHLGPSRTSGVAVTETLWVNAATYLPAELTWRMTALGKAKPWSGGAVLTVRTAFGWLPPTRANLAKLNVVIPPGFTRTS
jgi:hypothetical protein